MDHKLCRLCTQPEGNGWVKDLRGIVLNGGHNTALFLAVSIEIDSAAVRRVVLGVDEVEDACEVTPFRIPNRIGPGGDAGQVIILLVPEESLEIVCCLRLHKVTRDICDRYMTKTCLIVNSK